jgi:hypothetical protein
MEIEITNDDERYTPCLGTHHDFGALMTKVWHIMSSHSTALPHEPESTIWLHRQDQVLKSASNFQEVKCITSMDSLDQFYLYLKDCSPVTTVLDIKWDKKILYRTANLTTPTSELAFNNATTFIN